MTTPTPYLEGVTWKREASQRELFGVGSGHDLIMNYAKLKT